MDMGNLKNFASWLGATVIACVVVGGAFLSGCGAAPEDGEEIGTVEEAMGGLRSANFGFGVTDVFSLNEACLTGAPAASQTCLIPITKTHSYCLEPGFTAAEKTNITNALGIIQPVFTGQTYVHATDGAGCVADVRIGAGTCPGLCGPSATVQNCICTSALTEGRVLSESEQGTYRQLLGTRITLDRSDINAAFVVGSQAWQFVETHGFAHNLAFMLGLGAKGVGSANNSLVMGRAIAPTTGHLALSAGEKCKASNFDPSNTPAFFYMGSCPSD